MRAVFSLAVIGFWCKYRRFQNAHCPQSIILKPQLTVCVSIKSRAKIGSMDTARLSSANATLLADGRVLVAKGTSGALTSSIEIYDYTTNTWTAAASAVLSTSTSILLPNGQVLVRGPTIAILYDPVANTWTSAGSGLPFYSNGTATLTRQRSRAVLRGISSRRRDELQRRTVLVTGADS